MSTPHAVVSGASIAGLSTAWWLRRIGWEVTVLERAEAFRYGGQNVDIRGVAHQVLDRMGLTGAVKALNTTETGTVLVNETGHVTAELPSDEPDGATAELEILRGDLARTIRDHLPAGVQFCYGDTVADVRDDRAGLILITDTGRTLPADLLVIAEGVRSATRDRLFPGQVNQRDLDITMVLAPSTALPPTMTGGAGTPRSAADKRTCALTATAPPERSWSTPAARTSPRCRSIRPYTTSERRLPTPAGKPRESWTGSTRPMMSTSTGSPISACPPGTAAGCA